MRWAIIQIPSMAIDGPSMHIGIKVAMAIDGIEWSLSMGAFNSNQYDEISASQHGIYV